VPVDDQAPIPDPELRKKSRRAVVKYGLARLALFIILTVVIQVVAVVIDAPIPLVFTALLALFVALPLSMLVFSQWRLEATQSIAEYSRQRQEHKALVQRELSRRCNEENYYTQHSAPKSAQRAFTGWAPRCSNKAARHHPQSCPPS